MPTDKPKRVVEYEGTLIKEVPRQTGNDSYRVYLREYKDGTLYIEIRRWTKREKYDGPSRVGITFPLYAVKDVADALVEALELGELRLKRDGEQVDQ